MDQIPKLPDHPQLVEAQEFAKKLTELARSGRNNASLLVHVEGNPVLKVFPSRSMRLRSVSKMLAGLAYAREVEGDPAFAGKTISMAAHHLDTDPKYFDGGAHKAWQKTLPIGVKEVSHEAIARGMLHESSNSCTECIINIVGSNKINALAKEYGLTIQPFSSAYDELHNPLHGSAADMVKLTDNIASKESAAVQAAFQKVVMPFNVISVNDGTAAGFGKGGSGLMQIQQDLKHDFNYAWHAKHNGKNVSACFLTNNLDTPTKEFLETRFASFACEATCNQGFLAQCKEMLAQNTRSAVALLKKSHIPLAL